MEETHDQHLCIQFGSTLVAQPWRAPLTRPRVPGVHTHEEWKGMAQPVGLVVELLVLNRLVRP